VSKFGFYPGFVKVSGAKAGTFDSRERQDFERKFGSFIFEGVLYVPGILARRNDKRPLRLIQDILFEGFLGLSKGRAYCPL
jgi:hypothetical protein